MSTPRTSRANVSIRSLIDLMRSLLTEVDRPVGEPEGGERGLLETVDHEMGAA